MSAEQWTYISYREGVDSRVMRLGCLVKDFHNPRQRRPFLHREWSDEDRAKWVLEDERSYASLASSRGKTFSFGGGLQNLAEFDSWRNNGDLSIVVGVKGSKAELRESVTPFITLDQSLILFARPEKYFEEGLLQDEDARFWLSANLSVDRKLELIRQKMFDRPSIWMCTGVYIIEDARTWSIINNSTGTSTKATAPLPDVTAITQLLQLNPELHFKVGNGIMTASGSQIMGRRVWAAQFQRVSGAPKLVTHGQKYPVNMLRLLPTLSDYTRGEGEYENVLLTHDYATEDGLEAKDVEASAEYWRQYEVEMQALEKLQAE